MNMFKILVTALTCTFVTANRALMESCLDLGDLVFDKSKCSSSYALGVVEAALKQVTCAHNFRQEALLLTGAPTIGEAKLLLTKICKGESYKACTRWDGVEINGCDYDTVLAKVKSRIERDGKACTHDEYQELMFLTKSRSNNSARSYVDLMCRDAWSTVDKTTFTDVDDRFDDTFMAEYYDGGTFLNLETGNFQGADNPAYPTSDDSRSAGESIKAYYDGDAKSTVLLSDVQDLQCTSQAMMCCFGRDRQSNDNNGDCADNDCDDKGPADNSNLCYTDFPTIVPFPLASEGSIHCHGVAWGSDQNGLEARFKYNNLFYVSMYDHLYKRGYVEKTVPDEYVPMCGCIEEMPPVSRADCTEVTVTLTFTLSLDDLGLLYADAGDDLDVTFAACKGINFETGDAANNDLASYANVLVRDGKMKVGAQKTIFSTLVGYKTPGDNENEQSCKAAYRKATGGVAYPSA